MLVLINNYSRKNEFDGDIGCAYYCMRDKILSDGVGISYPSLYWHAPVYIEGRPKKCVCRLGYLFSIEKKMQSDPRV